MPLMSVHYGDGFHYDAEPVNPQEWFYHTSVRKVTPEELAEIERLRIEWAKLQAILKLVHEREEVEFDDMTEEERNACITDGEISFGRD